MRLDNYKIEVIKQYIFNEFLSVDDSSFARECIERSLYYAEENFIDFDNGQMECIINLIPEVKETEILDLFE